MNGAFEIVTADIGGTHARFALATIDAGRPIELTDIAILEVAAHTDIETAFHAYGSALGRPLPRLMAMALACAIEGDTLKMTNNPWVIRPSLTKGRLNLENLLIINDFAAIGHAVGNIEANHFERLFGPDQGLPHDGLISIVGAGTGLGVAQVLRNGGRTHVLATEGGHIDFAPLDATEDALLAELRKTYGRVSVERLLSGPGLFNLYRALGEGRGVPVRSLDPRELWAKAISGSDELAAEALRRFCLTLGSVCGDLALAHGSSAVVLAGGLLPRIAHLLPQSGFPQRFCAKGRFEARLKAIPVFRILHPEPGLLGAAAAYAAMA